MRALFLISSLALSALCSRTSPGIRVPLYCDPTNALLCLALSVDFPILEYVRQGFQNTGSGRQGEGAGVKRDGLLLFRW